MLAPEVIQPMGLAEPPRPDWRLRVAGATLSMQDASMRSQMGLEEQSAPHLVPAMCSVMPLLVERYREPMRFLGREIPPGARSAVQSERLDPDG